jgi:hypothetical protein
MTDNLREQALDALHGDWAGYVERFRRLSPEAQAAFLQQQGYARLGDLLAHVTAWWTDGQRSIRSILSDPNYPPQEYDVDDFNARAVAAAAGLSEEEILQRFEAARLAFIDLVKGLDEGAFQNERMKRRLHIEVIGHYKEHEFGNSV